nr:subtilisin inhibitor-like [Ipomoea batatas]
MSEPENQPKQLADEATNHSGMDGSSGEKTSWPELVGRTPEEAEKKIKEESRKISVQVVPPNSFVTMDYRLDRVRIFVDTSGKVARSPKLG